jgi:hypothetical protein
MDQPQQHFRVGNRVRVLVSRPTISPYAREGVIESDDLAYLDLYEVRLTYCACHVLFHASELQMLHASKEQT